MKKLLLFLPLIGCLGGQTAYGGKRESKVEGQKECLQVIDFALHGDIEETKSALDSVERKLYPIEDQIKSADELCDEPKNELDTLDFVEMPIFPGGEMALMKYIIKNLKFPQSVQGQGIRGDVEVRFEVKEDGSIGDVHILRSLDPVCDEEVIRVVKSLPRFIPGKQNGKPVDVWHTLPLFINIR